MPNRESPRRIDVDHPLHSTAGEKTVVSQRSVVRQEITCRATLSHTDDLHSTIGKPKLPERPTFFSEAPHVSL